MAWDTRDYYRGRENFGDYLANPAGVLGFSIPIGQWWGLPIRLSFWLLLSIVFLYIDTIYGVDVFDTTVAVLLLVGVLIAHDLGHRFFATRAGGGLSESLLWPAGGMIHPTAPSRPWDQILAHGGGLVVNLGFAAIAAAILVPARRLNLGLYLLNPLTGFFGGFPVFPDTSRSVYPALGTFFFINWSIVVINLFPFYWFDGGYLMEAILTQWIGRVRAVNATCLTGMVVAVPLFLICLFGRSFLGLVVCALLFAGSYTKRRELQAAGPAGIAGEPDYGSSWSSSDSEPAPRRKSRWASRSDLKKVAAARQEQEKIDAILVKVHAQGMQSLNWMERRALRKATERQREK